MKSMVLGRKLGLALFIIAIIFGIINHVMLHTLYYTFDVFNTYPLFLMIGLGFLFFPGANVKSLETPSDLSDFFRKSHVYHIVAWVIFTFAGIFGVFFLMNFYQLSR